MDLEPSPPPRFATSSPGGCPFFFMLTPPLKMTGNQTLKILSASLKKKNQQPLFKNPSSLQGQGKGSQERNCLKIIEHIGQIRRGLSCSSEIAQIIT